MSKIDLTVSTGIIYRKKILFLLHSKLNLWLFPGGHIDDNETPEMASIREAKEETGLDIKFLEYVPFDKEAEDISPCAAPFHINLHSVGDHSHYCLFYACSTDNPDFNRNHESQDMAWLSAEEIKSNDKIPVSVRKMALKILEKYGQEKN